MLSVGLTESVKISSDCWKKKKKERKCGRFFDIGGKSGNEPTFDSNV